MKQWSSSTGDGRRAKERRRQASAAGGAATAGELRRSGGGGRRVYTEQTQKLIIRAHSYTYEYLRKIGPGYLKIDEVTTSVSLLTGQN
uniref:Uncharacterized protein n=1 Tax=Oryza glumipatula TaxID=40148 RepID=A0A0D9ZVS6_9ORYZ